MLYPTTVIALPPDGMLAINSGSLLAIAFSVRPGRGLAFAMAQLSATQDFSLRVWVSRTPGGLFVPTNASYWHLNRTTEPILLVHDASGTPVTPYKPLALPLLPQSYHMNVLNLVNTENVCSFSSIELYC